MIPFPRPHRSATALVCCVALAFASFASAAVNNSSSRSSSSSSRRTTSSSTSSSSRSLGAGSGSGSSSSGARNYRSNTLMEDALIQVDAETRSVIIVTDPRTHDSIAKVIDSLDHPRPQVLIKVIFVEVELDKGLDAGIEGSYTFSPSRSGTVGTLFGMANTIANATNGSGLFGTIAANNWSATLHALSTCGKAKVLSRPSIMARNNQEAVIVVGKEVPIVTNSEITDNGNTINTVTYQDVGIILRVTPFITSNKSVEMIVAPEISELSGSSVSISSNASAPVINKRSAETVVVTPNATTIVIGGLMQKDSSSVVKKVPLLGDIPVLGWPFRYTAKSESKSELLIFLTPYIVDTEQTLDQLTVDEANRAQLLRQMATPAEIKNELDTLRLVPVEPPLPTSTTTTTTTVVQAPVAKPVAPKATPTPKPTPKPAAPARPTATPKPAAKKGSPTPSPTPVMK